MLWIRLAILILLFWLIRKAYKSFISSSPEEKSNIDKMVKCAYCGIHVPEAEAISERDLSFCSRDHKEAFIKEQRDDRDQSGKNPPPTE